MELVKWFDSQPVKGLVMVVLVGIIGTVLALTNPFGTSCSDSPLRHVYHAQRLHVVAKCQTVTFRVVAWRREHDGDYHVNGEVQNDKSWVNEANEKSQHGFTVFEFVPGDPKPKFAQGEVLRVTTTKVLDNGHGGWIEGHPIFKVSVVNTAKAVTGNPEKLAPPTEGS